MIFCEEYLLNNCSFSIKFLGETKNKKINKDEVRKFADKIFKNKKEGLDEKELLEQVKNIFRYFDEKELSIEINDDKKHVYIKYLDGVLVKYNKIKKGYNSESINVRYSDTKGIDIHYCDNRAKKEDDNLKFHITYALGDMLDNLRDLTFIKPKYITNAQKTLIQIYELFYNKKPDFTFVDIEKEFQAMMYILKEYLITLEDSDEFTFYYNKPSSRYIHKLLKNLILPTTCLDKLKSNKAIKPFDQKVIKLIGGEINEYLNQFKEEDRLNEFNKLCIINETKKHRVSNWATTEEIIDSSNIKCEEKDVVNSLKLIKTISQKRKEELNL